MKAYPGKLHIGLDGWTSPNVISFLGVIVYMVKDDKIIHTILDFLKYVTSFVCMSIHL